MFLGFFRINDPYRLLGLLLLLLLFALPYFIDPAPITIQELKNAVLGEALLDGKRMYVEVFDSTAPVTSGVYWFTSVIFGRSLTGLHLVALVLIFFQASFFAILLINNKAYNDNTYVPGVIFGLLCFFSFDILSFSPELLGSTVLLLALNNLFKEIEFRIQKDEIILNLGIYLGIATLIIFSYAIFLFATILILFIFTRLTIRKLFLLLFGFGLPHILLISLYYFWGEAGALFHNYYGPNFTVHGEMLVSFRSMLVLTALPVVYFVFSLFMLNREARFTKYQSQLFSVMFQWLLVCVIQAFLAREFTPHSMLIFIPSLSYFISHYILLIRRKWIAESMLWVFLSGLISVSLLARYDEIESVNYATLFPVKSPYEKQVSHQRVMILADDPGIYRQNRLAGFFLDWDLSREVFEQPDYYENVLLVAKAFKTNPPDVVIDPSGLMGKFFERIPELQSRYQRKGVIWERTAK